MTHKRILLNIEMITALALLLVFAPLSAAGEPGADCVSPPDGLVSWWPGDGNADDIQDGNSGGLFNGVAFQSGMVGLAFSLDGVNDYIEVPPSANLDLPEDVTVDLWFKLNVATCVRINQLISKGAGSISGIDVPSAFFVLLDPEECVLRAGFEYENGDNESLIGPPITDSIWHHVAYIREGNEHRMYLDGNLVVEGLFVGGPGPSSSFPLFIGALLNTPTKNGFFNGLIDEVEVFDRALTDPEVKSIFEAGSAGKCKQGQFGSFVLDNAYLNFGGGFSPDGYAIGGRLILAQNSDGIDLLNDQLSAKVGASEITIPAGSFVLQGSKYRFSGAVDGVFVRASFRDRGAGEFTFNIQADSLDLSGTQNPTTCRVAIGNDFGEAQALLRGQLHK